MIRWLLFNTLRAYVWLEQTRFMRWLLNKQPDVIIEPLPRPGDGVPTVNTTPEIFLDGDLKAAYAVQGKTLRRVAQNDAGELLFIRKRTKSERKALKRAKRRNGEAQSA